MAIETDQFVHLSRPLAATAHNIQTNIAPLTVIIQPQAIFSILDHASRREISESSLSTRVIGALVGVRSEDGTEVEVRSCFAIPHTENEDQVEVDVEYQKTMFALTLRASPRESLLGWYTTSPELNSFSALIQNYFASPDTGTFPHPAVHLTMATAPGEAPQTRCYISAPVAINPERAAESCLFMQVPHKLAFGGDAERNALEAIAASKDDESRLAPVEPEMEILARAIEQTMDLLSRVGDWVNNVLDEEDEPNDALGQYLMNALSLAPKVDPSQIEHDFNNHIQDVLMVSYLANTIRTQIDLAQRLASSNFGTGEKDAESKPIDSGDKTGEERGQNSSGRGGRGGKRGGGRGGNNRAGGQTREPREPREPREE